MKYNKQPLTFEDQAELLIQRGLIAEKEKIIAKLKAVNYYRLSGYWYDFRNPDDTFKPNTNLDAIWQRYTFDRQLRLLVLDAIERFEIHIRTQIAYELSHNSGPFGYLTQKHLPKLSAKDHNILKTKLQKEFESSREDYINHFKTKYASEQGLPLWIAVELMTFGTMLTTFKGLEQPIKQKIASTFLISDSVLNSWLRTLNTIRNICAHHSRLWNRVIGLKPLIPRKKSEWCDPVKISNNRIFGILTILKYLLGFVAPQSNWQSRLEALLNRYPDIPRKSMGFPEDWHECPIWQTSFK